ncbi:hypothetical protein GGTG_08155 [Gaeumannomyces tritici R3-111a-1]|uniref:Uncharacterized protein n=1 Tax=Gaeumannomyces tritici (strain R3-111a-1) TaxID=644352 RepID=J3P3S0_GAET3|nr:hypothetical protein GGTG_08155 [Gaeumannomyces tritici R3-111a-1]EJT74314.1 hypothetical protein GGTG_08155 [Gaeumannomyces tritici R3-111a-1]
MKQKKQKKRRTTSTWTRHQMPHRHSRLLTFPSVQLLAAPVAVWCTLALDAQIGRLRAGGGRDKGPARGGLAPTPSLGAPPSLFDWDIQQQQRAPDFDQENSGGCVCRPP